MWEFIVRWLYQLLHKRLHYDIAQRARWLVDCHGRQRTRQDRIYDGDGFSITAGTLYVRVFDSDGHWVYGDQDRHHHYIAGPWEVSLHEDYRKKHWSYYFSKTSKRV